MIKILVASPIKEDATSFYRCFGPINHLKRNFDVEIIDATLPGYSISWDVMTGVDVVFIQRPSTGDHLAVMEIAKNTNTPVWIDFDDDYLNIPETNPRYELYANPHRVACIRKAIELADMITVSTISIRESIGKNTSKDKNFIHVIPNAIDEQVFDCRVPGLPELGYQKNIIMWRGGDTHGHDMDPYIEKMVDLYKTFQNYDWAFFGFAPEKFLKLIDNKRIILFPWGDIMQYLKNLFELRPRISIVPWANLEFNKSKSNCSWIESTLSGAATVFPNWSTEFVDGMVGYNTPENFYQAVSGMLSLPEKAGYQALKSFETLQRFTLSAMNPVRYALIKSLIASKKNKLGFRSAEPAAALVSEYTPEEYANFTHLRMVNSEYDHFKEDYFKLADWLVTEYRPASVIDFGCGSGAMIERLIDVKVPDVTGFDINTSFKRHWDIRNPYYIPNYVTADLSDITLEGIYDIGVCINTLDHLESEKADEFISRMANHFTRFYFASSPHRISQSEDKQLGRKNIRTFEAWRMAFEHNGWKFIGNPQKIQPYDQIFFSMRIKSQL
jgi:2-polyprenyl-3-methyl-5-hydroxy-6-metoxy-1,4-benzoquinol methylase